MSLKADMNKNIRRYTDEKLARELFFAEGFAPYPNDPNALAETVLREALASV